MDLERVHINPVAPDPNASGRYGSAEERSASDQKERPQVEREANDRLEISERGRQTNRALALPPDMDFARKALDLLPPTDPERIEQLTARIESGYYTSPVVIDQLVACMTGAS